MKKYVIVFLFLLYLPDCIAQTDSTFNLLFLKNDSICKIKTVDIIDGDKELVRKRYRKLQVEEEYPKLGDIEFYICDELFIYKGISKIDTCSNIGGIKFTTIKQLEKAFTEIATANINGENPLIMSKGHLGNIFLYEELNNSEYARYRVTWIEQID